VNQQRKFISIQDSQYVIPYEQRAGGVVERTPQLQEPSAQEQVAQVQEADPQPGMLKMLFVGWVWVW
jgi:hypothetical protein